MFKSHSITRGLCAVIATAISLSLAACAESDTRTEVEKLTEAATSGDTEAQYLLGQRYCCGYEAGKNEEKAVAWWCQAARDGHAESQFELGRLYQEGDLLPMMSKTRYLTVPVKKDNVIALAWYATAAKNGNTLAKKYEALLYRALSDTEKQQAYTMLKDPRSIPCRYRGQTL